MLKVEKLVSGFETAERHFPRTPVVDGVSFTLEKGRTLGVVGESGCGKTLLALSLMGLLPEPHGRVFSGSILFNGRELTDLSESEWRDIRGNRIAMIFQEPMTALNPVLTVGFQIEESLLAHRKMPKKDARARAIELLREVGIPNPEIRLSEYPHQLSGGMRQRVMIAMALACEPEIVIADEPTTALDVTIQAQILDLLRDRQRDRRISYVLITHDLGVVHEMADDVMVMYAGKCVEMGPRENVFKRPLHPYTRALLASLPTLTHPRKTALATIGGMVPDFTALPSGCRFRERCAHAKEACRDTQYTQEALPGHFVTCCRWKELGERGTA